MLLPKLEVLYHLEVGNWSCLSPVLVNTPEVSHGHDALLLALGAVYVEQHGLLKAACYVMVYCVATVCIELILVCFDVWGRGGRITYITAFRMEICFLCMGNVS